MYKKQAFLFFTYSVYKKRKRVVLSNLICVQVRSFYNRKHSKQKPFPRSKRSNKIGFKWGFARGAQIQGFYVKLTRNICLIRYKLTLTRIFW